MTANAAACKRWWCLVREHGTSRVHRRSPPATTQYNNNCVCVAHVAHEPPRVRGREIESDRVVGSAGLGVEWPD